MICKIIKAHFRIDQIGIRRYLPDRRLLLIVLIPDLADQLFQNILHGHDAVGAAVFINNDRNVRFGLLELFQQQTDRFHLQRVDRRQQDVPKRPFCNAAPNVEILLVNGAEDVVNRVLIDQQTGIFRLRKQRGDLLLRCGDREGRKVCAVNQNILRALLGEVDRIFEELSLVFVNAAVLLDLIHEHQKLLLRHFIVGAEVKDLGQQSFPKRKERIQRRKDPNQDLQHRRRQHGACFRAVLRNALRRDLAENQHNDRNNDGRNRSTGIAVVLYKQHRADGGRCDVYNVVADQNRRQQPIVLLQQLADERCFFVSLFCKRFQSCRICGGKGRLRR